MMDYQEITYILEILDTAGAEQFTPMRDLYIKNSQIIFLVFSVIARSSFNDLPDLRDQVFRIKEYTPIILVANKCDLEDRRVVFTQEIIELANRWECPYFETSALNGSNIDNMFLGGIEMNLSHLLISLEARLKYMKTWKWWKKNNLKKKITMAKIAKETRSIMLKKHTLESKLNILPPFPDFTNLIVKKGTFISDLSSLLLDKSTTDTNLIIQSIFIPVHSAILSVRCPQLLKFIENNQSLPSNFSVSGIYLLLEYLYTSQIPKEFKLQFGFQELQELAKYFNLKKLMKLILTPANEKIQTNCTNQLFKDIQLLQTRSYISDITITLDDKSKFLLHKCILISRCDWFKAAFRFQWMEGQQSTIHIPNISSSVFQLLIDYLYSDQLKCNGNLTYLAELLIAADQYQLPRLKELCELELSKYVTPITLLNLFEYSIIGLANGLNSVCLHFLPFPEFYEVCHKQEKFNQLISPSCQTLITETYSKYSNILKEKARLELEIQTCELEIAALKTNLKK